MIGLRLGEHLQSTGQQTRVWVPGAGPAEDGADALGLPVGFYDLASVTHTRRWRAGRGNWKLTRSLRRFGPGLVHVHSPEVYGACRWGLRWSGLKRVVHVHLEMNTDGPSWAFQSPPELIITCARFLVEQVRRALPATYQNRQRIEAVPNCVDAEKFAPGDKRLAKQKLAAPKTPLLLMLANLAPHKGQETAIRAVALLKQRGIDVSCWLAGVERHNEGYTARLEALTRELEVEDRVRLLGQRNDAPELLRAADFFLLPSTREGLPLSVLEAQAAGVPVLAAPTAGVPEVIEDGSTGFLVAADDAGGYANRLEVLLGNQGLCRRVTESAQRRVVREHGWKTYCDRVVQLYQEVLQQPTGSTRSERAQQNTGNFLLHRGEESVKQRGHAL